MVEKLRYRLNYLKVFSAVRMPVIRVDVAVIYA